MVLLCFVLLWLYHQHLVSEADVFERHSSGLLHLYLTLWGPDKMAAIFQTTFSNVISGMKMHEFRLKFHCFYFAKSPFNNITALVQAVAWHQPGDKPLSEPRLVSLPTHLCVNRPQWVTLIFIVVQWNDRQIHEEKLAISVLINKHSNSYLQQCNNYFHNIVLSHAMSSLYPAFLTRTNEMIAIKLG